MGSIPIGGSLLERAVLRCCLWGLCCAGVVCVGVALGCVCPSGLRGWAQVPLARAARVQIPQVSLIHSSGVCAFRQIYATLADLGTVAILAQGTSWAVAVTQAFFVAPCVAVVLLRLFGLGLRFGVAVRPVRGSWRGCYDLVAAVGSVWGIVVCVVFRFRRLLRRSVLVSWLWLRLAAARKQAASREIVLRMSPLEAPKALQASERSELLDPMRASCWISAQH